MRLARFAQSGAGAYSLTDVQDLNLAAGRLTAGDVDGDSRNEIVVLGDEDEFQVIR